MNEPTWLTLARKDIGIRESPGTADNAVIIGWAKALAIALHSSWLGSFYQHDSIPWCALWLAHVLNTDGKRILPAGQVLGAMNWRAWGQPVAKAVPGCVLVFERDGGGHVGFYVGETADSQWYFVLGGNQGDHVCIERIAVARCVARRWPAELPPEGLPVVLAVGNAPISQIQAAASHGEWHTVFTIGQVIGWFLPLFRRRFWLEVRHAWRRAHHHAGRAHAALTGKPKP